MKSHLWLANNKCPVKPVTHAVVFLPSPPFVCFSPVIVSPPAAPATQRTAEEQPDQQEPEFSRKPGKHLSSPVCHTNGSARGRGGTAHRHSSRMAAAEEKHERCWNGSDSIQNDASISRNLFFFALHIFFFLCDGRFKLCAFFVLQILIHSF